MRLKIKHVLTLAVAGVVAALLLVPGPVPSDAQRLPSRLPYRDQLGTVTSDTLRWLASGTVPGSGGLRVDTIINTARDTTIPGQVFIGGANSVLVELLTRTTGTDSVNILYSFQVSSSPDTTAMWHTLSATYNAVQSNANDTVAILLSSPILFGLPDTSAATALATAETGMRTVPLADRALVYGSRYLRVLARAQATAGDSNLASGVVTLRWPR